MTIQELYDTATILGLTSEEVIDTYKFVGTLNSVQRDTAFCGLCRLRNTEECPFPTSSAISQQPCNSYLCKENIIKHTS